MEATEATGSSMNSGKLPMEQDNTLSDKGKDNELNDNQNEPTPIAPGAAAGNTQEKHGKKFGKQSFASLFKDNRAPMEASLLKFIEPPIGEVVIGCEEIDTFEKSFGFCLVGYVMGSRPSAYNVLNFVKRWGGNVKFVFKENGWIMFQFANELQRDSILNGGPYRILGRQLFLKVMPSCFLFSKEDMVHLPSWVQIYGLPADCWTTSALSRIALVVGKPIHTDQLTISKKGSTYARVLVEIDAKKSRVWDYSVKLPTGKVIVVTFKYELDPKFCNMCNSLGHVTEMCGVASRKNGNTQQKKEQNTNNKCAQDDTMKDMTTHLHDIPESSNSMATHTPEDAGCAMQSTTTAVIENILEVNANMNEQSLGGQKPVQQASVHNDFEKNLGKETAGTVLTHGEHNLKEQTTAGLDSKRNTGKEDTAKFPEIEQMSNEDFGDDDLLSFEGDDSDDTIS